MEKDTKNKEGKPKKKSKAISGVKGVQPRDGNGNLIGFTSENQPSPEAKSRGRKKKYMLQRALEAKITGKLKKEYRAVFEYYGIDPDDMSFEEFLHFKMISKIITDSDVKAYVALMDRIYGKPKQKVEIEDEQKNYTKKEIHQKLKDLGLLIDVNEAEDADVIDLQNDND